VRIWRILTQILRRHSPGTWKVVQTLFKFNQRTCFMGYEVSHEAECVPGARSTSCNQFWERETEKGQADKQVYQLHSSLSLSLYPIPISHGNIPHITHKNPTELQKSATPLFLRTLIKAGLSRLRKITKCCLSCPWRLGHTHTLRGAYKIIIIIIIIYKVITLCNSDDSKSQRGWKQNKCLWARKHTMRGEVQEILMNGRGRWSLGTGRLNSYRSGLGDLLRASWIVRGLEGPGWGLGVLTVEGPGWGLICRGREVPGTGQ